MLTFNGVGEFDRFNTMYPSKVESLSDGIKTTVPYSTVYGYCAKGEIELPNQWSVKEGEYFSYSSTEEESIYVSDYGSAILFTRLGHMHQNNLGGPIESSGRLCYIDGCSDSLLIYPSRAGDPSLNLLHFPEGISQKFHIHPSIRLGYIAKGSGVCWTRDNVYNLEEGMIFCIEERELHRFTTSDTEMTVIAYHPDGDWGPTDQSHAMLNRTYIIK
jgi:quercetin dioxygenase-like cupin family protein